MGAGRRSSSVSAFGRIGQSISDAWGGLTQGIADVGQSVGESLGYGYDKAPTFTGSQDIAAINAHTEAQREKGESLAQRDQAVNTVANLASVNPTMAPVSVGTQVATNALSETLSPSAKQSYDATKEKGLGSLAKTGINRAATGLLGLPSVAVSTGVDIASLAMMTDQDQVSSSRRSNAISSFTPGNGSTGSRVTSTSSSQPQTTNNWMWEPASYGVGDYGSHVKGLLS